MNISPIERYKLEGFSFFVKREDKLGLINGNKARKLAYFLRPDFKAEKILSYGSIQSNALYALSELAKMKQIPLFYVCKAPPKSLTQKPSGNYKFALENGVNFIYARQGIALGEFALSLAKQNGAYFIPEGVACKEAEFGLKELALEIEKQATDLGLDFDLFLSAGTGTSAAFLAKNSKFELYVVPCVGDELYLKRQMSELVSEADLSRLYIVKPPQKFHFAKPDKRLFAIYEKALKIGLELDLIYDCLALLSLLENKQRFTKPLLFIHQGGLSGNESMLERYKFLGLDRSF